MLGTATTVLADDAQHCLDLVGAKQFDYAHSVCHDLELNDPGAAQAFAYYQLYVSVGSERIQSIAIRGIDKATPEEKRALETAKRYLLVAAKAGSPEAQYLLALTIGLFKSIEVEAGQVRYDEKQTYWLKKAADQDVAEANYLLGIRALSAFGTLLIDPEYLPYLEHAVKLEHVEAGERLDAYMTATRLAAEESLDDPDALRRHATELWSHPGGDVRKANRLMRLLADAGDEKAMLVAGKWSWPEDAEGARKYLAMAADVGNDKAMISLGDWFACNGDAEEASRWFEMARERNHPEASDALRELVEWGLDEWECRFL